MASREELLESIKPDMRLDKGFFLKIYAYNMTTPGFAAGALARLEDAGCTRAKEYYRRVIGEWQQEHDKAMKNVAEWYSKQEFKKGVNESRKREQETELLRRKRQLLTRKRQLLMRKRKILTDG